MRVRGTLRSMSHVKELAIWLNSARGGRPALRRDLSFGSAAVRAHRSARMSRAALATRGASVVMVATHWHDGGNATLSGLARSRRDRCCGGLDRTGRARNRRSHLRVAKAIVITARREQRDREGCAWGCERDSREPDADRHASSERDDNQRQDRLHDTAPSPKGDWLSRRAARRCASRATPRGLGCPRRLPRHGETPRDGRGSGTGRERPAPPSTRLMGRAVELRIRRRDAWPIRPTSGCGPRHSPGTGPARRLRRSTSAGRPEIRDSGAA